MGFSSLHVGTRYPNLIIPTSLSVRLLVVNSAKDHYRACFCVLIVHLDILTRSMLRACDRPFANTYTSPLTQDWLLRSPRK